MNDWGSHPLHEGELRLVDGLLQKFKFSTEALDLSLLVS